MYIGYARKSERVCQNENASESETDYQIATFVSPKHVF